MAKSDTPLLDQLEGGKWPSFIDDMKQAAKKKPMAKDLLGQLELSYKEKIGHWKHGGIVGVKGYGAGVIGPGVECDAADLLEGEPGGRGGRSTGQGPDGGVILEPDGCVIVLHDNHHSILRGSTSPSHPGTAGMPSYPSRAAVRILSASRSSSTSRARA